MIDRAGEKKTTLIEHTTQGTGKVAHAVGTVVPRDLPSIHIEDVEIHQRTPGCGRHLAKLLQTLLRQVIENPSLTPVVSSIVPK